MQDLYVPVNKKGRGCFLSNILVCYVIPILLPFPNSEFMYTFLSYAHYYVNIFLLSVKFLLLQNFVNHLLFLLFLFLIFVSFYLVIFKSLFSLVVFCILFDFFLPFLSFSPIFHFRPNSSAISRCKTRDSGAKPHLNTSQDSSPVNSNEKVLPESMPFYFS